MRFSAFQQGVAIAVACGLFMLSCGLEVGHGEGGFLEDGFEPLGWQLLIYGWMLPDPALVLTWLSNPVFLGSLVYSLRKAYAPATILAALGAACGAIPLLWVASSSSVGVRLESPVALTWMEGRLELRLGYFVWVASHLLMFLTTLASWRQVRENHGRQVVRLEDLV
jgi:hypothetical protein